MNLFWHPRLHEDAYEATGLNANICSYVGLCKSFVEKWLCSLLSHSLCKWNFVSHWHFVDAIHFAQLWNWSFADVQRHL